MFMILKTPERNKVTGLLIKLVEMTGLKTIIVRSYQQST